MRNANIVNMMYGSHLYGLNTENSDVDYKGIYMPTLDELLLGNYKETYKSSTGNPNGRNTSDDIDYEVMALSRFIKLAIGGETTTIDMLHCKNPICSSEIWEDLVSKRTMFYTKNMSSYMGYCMSQAAKYGMKGSRLASLKLAIDKLSEFQDQDCDFESVLDEMPQNKHLEIVVKKKTDKLPAQKFYKVLGKQYQSTNSIQYVLNELQKWWDRSGERAKQAMRNEGVDYKALSHAIRVSYQMYHIFKDGDFEYPLPETQYILDVKLGKIHAMEVLDKMAELIETVNVLSETTKFPDSVDVEFWNNWLLDVYKNEFSIGDKNV
jgi:predicted nucleotidyltransferase